MGMVQLQLLNRILQSKDMSLITLNNIDQSFFSDYKEEFNFIKNHFDTYGNVPDNETFLSKFNNFDLIEVTETDNYLIDKLYKDKNKRTLAGTFNEVRDDLMNDRTEEAINTLMNASEKIAKAKHISSIDIINDNSRYNDYLDRCNDYKNFYVRTGFNELDEIVGGWDRKEELATIVARPNVGKSWILIKSSLEALKQGLTVGIYSGEMSARKVGYRFDTLNGHLSNKGIIRGNESLMNEYKIYMENLPKEFTGKLKVLTPDLIGGPAGVTALRAFIEKENLDILFVDQHSLLEDDRNARNPIEKAANISRDLKNLQVMKQIPIISVSQQNRSSTEHGVGTEHVAQSDRIGQDSTIVIFIERTDNKLKLELIKSRDSVNFKTLEYAVDFDKGIFDYQPGDKPEDAEKSQQLKEEFESDKPVKIIEQITGENVF